MRRLEGRSRGERPGSLFEVSVHAREKERSMLSVDTALPDVEELHKLVEQGQERLARRTARLENERKRNI